MSHRDVSDGHHGVSVRAVFGVRERKEASNIGGGGQVEMAKKYGKRMEDSCVLTR